mmetsp:Transcript_39023/g.102840  ORF Transcript_39023/g.102840 Transcript_39023/m.102840 type:complete len:135 (+) Transcript_39023:126-530(+)
MPSKAHTAQLYRSPGRGTAPPSTVPPAPPATISGGAADLDPIHFQSPYGICDRLFDYMQALLEALRHEHSRPHLVGHSECWLGVEKARGPQAACMRLLWRRHRPKVAQDAIELAIMALATAAAYLVQPRAQPRR